MVVAQDPDVQPRAILALADLLQPFHELVPQLEGMLTEKGNRAAAAHLLRQIGTPEALKALREHGISR